MESENESDETGILTPMDMKLVKVETMDANWKFFKYLPDTIKSFKYIYYGSEDINPVIRFINRQRSLKTLQFTFELTVDELLLHPIENICEVELENLQLIHMPLHIANSHFLPKQCESLKILKLLRLEKI